MIYRFSLILLLFSSISYAQDTLKVKIESQQEYSQILVYQVLGANQEYLSNASKVNDEFLIPIAEDVPKGMYRIYFSNSGYFDFIYNNEAVSVTFDADDPEATAVFDKSKDNIIYQNYLNAIEGQQFVLDSLQVAYLKEPSVDLKASYQRELQALYELQNNNEIASEGLLAQSFIKANEKYYHPELVAQASDYFQVVNDHFYDYIDFSSEALLASSFFVDKAVEYIFYMNIADDPEMDELVKREAIIFTMNKVGTHIEAKREVLNALLYAFATQEQASLTQFLMDEYYLKLGEDFVDQEFVNSINGMLATARGVLAPEIEWDENGEMKNLHSVEVQQYCILVFWSTTCSHCIEEIPDLYAYTYDLDNVKVIAVALEEYREGFDSYKQTMPKWTHVLGLNKWENEYAKTYQISSTPSFFVLDEAKRIIDKPNTLADLKLFIEAN